MPNETINPIERQRLAQLAGRCTLIRERIEAESLTLARLVRAKEPSSTVIARARAIAELGVRLEVQSAILIEAARVLPQKDQTQGIEQSQLCERTMP